MRATTVASASAFVLMLIASMLTGCFSASNVPAASVTSAVALAPGPFEISNDSITSFDGTKIGITIHKPAGASVERRVPVVLQMEGWGESLTRPPESVKVGRCIACDEVKMLLDAGFGVVSISPRGWSDSGGESHVMDPDYEARDVIAVIDVVATWPWVALDAPGDPRLGATGFSYGGLFQWVTAFEETRLTGRTRFNALNPVNSPFDFVGALAPRGIPKTSLFTAAIGVGATARVAPEYQKWYAEAMATGEAPAAFLDEVSSHGGLAYVDAGLALDVPVLLQQSPADLHWPLNDAWTAYATALTPRARAESMLVTHRNGHATTYPWQDVRLDNPCTGSQTWKAFDFRVQWFRKQLASQDVDLGAPVQLATREGDCWSFDALPDALASYNVTPLTPAGTPMSLAAGARVLLPVAKGPMTLAGIPTLNATIDGLHPDARIFFALAIGRSQTEYRIVGDQWTPVRAAPTTSLDFGTDLSGVVENVPDGSGVFLATAPNAEIYAGHGSREPGAVVLKNIQVGLPVIEVGP